MPRNKKYTDIRIHQPSGNFTAQVHIKALLQLAQALFQPELTEALFQPDLRTVFQPRCIRMHDFSPEGIISA
jgi:hypothetical protein